MHGTFENKGLTETLISVPFTVRKVKDGTPTVLPSKDAVDGLLNFIFRPTAISGDPNLINFRIFCPVFDTSGIIDMVLFIVKVVFSI